MDPEATGRNKITEINVCVDPVVMNEFSAVVQGCRSRKPPGSDGLNFEPIKPCSVYRTLSICAGMFFTFPKIGKWQIVLTFKKGDRNAFGNYGVVGLRTTSYKLYTSLLAK